MGLSTTAAVLGMSFVVQAQQDVEAPPVLAASAIVPKELLAGPHHRVAENVGNDGFLNHYVIQSDFGEFTAVSTAKLHKRVDEINALVKLDHISKTEVFAKAFKDAGQAGLEGVKNLITDPFHSVSGAISGVGKIFGRLGEGVRSKRSESEDGPLASVIGVSSMKREYAAELGVDPYTDNKVLQAKLNDVAMTGFLGDLGPKAAIAAIPGGVGVALSVTQNTYALNEILRTTAPADLRTMNREKLVAMGVTEVVADLFIDNALYTPTEQTVLVDSLAQMHGVANREAFVRFAVLAADTDVTYFRQRQAAMYAGFHKNVASIAKFVPIGQIAAAQLADDTLVFVVPLDLLAWTTGARDFITNASHYVDQNLQPAGKQLWLAGAATPLARSKMTALGWQVTEGSTSKLLPALRY
jgi:hypothetical protein